MPTSIALSPHFETFIRDQVESASTMALKRRPRSA